MGEGVQPEEDGRGDGLGEEGDVEALEEALEALGGQDLPEGVEDAPVLGDQVIEGAPAVVT
jgi:hypothetical protein